MMFVYLMGWALVWALAWVMSGPGPKPRPLKVYRTRGPPSYRVFEGGLIRLFLGLSDVVLGRVLSVLAILLLF